MTSTYETQTPTQPAVTREQILDHALEFINKRIGMDARNYISDWRDQDGIKAYRSEYREILRDGRDARALLGAIRWRTSSIEVETLLLLCRGGGRLTYSTNGFEYCPGQYWCTEYRRAMCCYLRDCLTASVPRADCDTLKKTLSRECGRGVVKRWFY